MSDSLYVTAASALDLKLKMEILTNNLANVNTTGFKEELVSARTNESVNTRRLPAEGEAAVENTPGDSTPIMQTNLRTYTNFENGPQMKTGNPLDFAISGRGFFKVQTADGFRYTRNGSFTLNSDNKLVTHSGALVLGDRGEIEIEGGNVSIDDEGRLTVDGDEVGKLKIVNIGNLKSLKKDGNLLFKASGIGVVENDSEGVTIQQGYLERSNVNGIKALTFMIASLRLFETYQKVILTNDRANDASINEVGKPV